MSWHNVKLIFFREVRDQLRDRRTLFMIGVLPLLLYPLLMMSFFYLSQFLGRNPSRVLVLAMNELPETPRLLDKNRFSADLFDKPENVDILDVTWKKYLAAEKNGHQESAADYAKRIVRQGDFDTVVVFPDDFNQQLTKYREATHGPTNDSPPKDGPPKDGTKTPDNSTPSLKVPNPEIYHNSAQEKSQMAYGRVQEPLYRWTESIGRQNLKDRNLPADVARPFQVHETDVAEEGHKDAVIWSKILPFVLMIWALTGAFYPAVDLCAGEKERGTLETLLSSPATRTEIVCGKLFTVMTFSMATSLLNLLFMGLTAGLIIQRVGSGAAGGQGFMNLGPPPAWSILWLALALIPMSAFFSALCLAVAAFARSTKEGQYYLMPLILIIMPLMILPMTPGIELDLGKSLIPVTGLVLLLKTLLEGNYAQAAPFIPPVVCVTLCGVWFAIRWAVEQFNKESVLFREGERFDLSMWFRQLVRERQDTPSPMEAVFCGLLILVIKFVLDMAFSRHKLDDINDVMVMALVPQLTAILAPTLIMTVLLTRRPRKTLLLQAPQPWKVLVGMLLAVVLAVVLQPTVLWMHSLIQDHLYPLGKEAKEALGHFTSFLKGVPTTKILLLLAVVPAVIEELAFRGFILSGLRHLGSKRQAIIWTSIFFGLAHGMIQQSINAVMLGVILGYIAVQTGSILPGMLFHVTHNGLTVLFGDWFAKEATEGGLSWLFSVSGEGANETLNFTPGAIIASLTLAALILYWFRRLPAEKSDEESLRDQIREHAV